MSPESLISPTEVTEADLHSPFLSHIVYEQFANQAANHSGKKGRFLPIDWNPRGPENPEGYPGQLLSDDVIEVIDAPNMEPVIEQTAQEFLEGFSSILNCFENNQPLLSSIAEKVTNGDNVIVVTNHGEIYDIALILAALRVSLAKNMVRSGSEPVAANNFNIIVHRMISQLGISNKQKPDEPTPALTVLQLLCNTYLSFPRTESAKKANVPRALDRACTNRMLEKLTGCLAAGGQILAFAPSGSKDESLRDKLGRLRKVIKPVNKGTVQLMQSENSWVLGVSVALDGTDGPTCSFSELKQCTTDEECHQLLDSIAEHHSRLTGIKTHYARSHDELENFRAEAKTEAPTTPETSRLTAEQKLALKAGLVTAGALAGIALYRHFRSTNQ